jgi:hypothetical protein
MKKIFYVLALITLTMSSFAYAARQTFSVLVDNGAVANYCSDETGVHVNPDGSGYLTGASIGSCTTTPPPPPPNFIQQIRASIFYRPAGGTSVNADVTFLKNIIGRINATQQVVEWPYVTGSTPSFTLVRNNVIAAKINIPTNAAAVMHTLKNVSYFSSPGVTVAVSTIPGDFNSSQAACVKHNAPNNDAPMLYLRAGGALNNSICRLNLGGTYYLNLKFENPNQGGLLTLLWY